MSSIRSTWLAGCTTHAGLHVQRRAVRHGRVVVRRGVLPLDQQDRLALEVGRVDDLVLRQRVILGDRDVIERHTRQRLRHQLSG